MKKLFLLLGFLYFSLTASYAEDIYFYQSKFAEKVKQECKNKEFDCIIGLSGGLDSSYCVYVTKKIMG